MSKKIVTKTIEVAGKSLTLTVNKLAPQANTSVVARYGDTEVLVTVVSANAKPGQGFFPLTIDFVERLYAGGIIKGSRWVKREGRPTDEAVLTGRLIDRSLRPLFPKDFFDEVQITITLLSTDGENDHDILSIVAASAALHVSNIPWNGPIGSVRVGLIKKDESQDMLINPQISEMDYSDLDLVVTTNSEAVVMIEAGANQVPENQMTEAIEFGAKEAQKIVGALEELRKEVGEEKFSYVGKETDRELLAEIEKGYLKEIEPLVFTGDPTSKPKTDQIEILKQVLVEKYAENKNKGQIGELVDLIIKKHVRKAILEKSKRADGRKPDEVRPISVEVGLLPRTHGSAIFQRGLTQIMSVVTLASPSLEQWIETAEGMEEKRYLHHYNCPPYSMGETGRSGSTGRREIGHSALAERALFPVIPTQEKFPYTIRVVSEVLSENGSSSMGSASGSTLALMDAGVPISFPVAGVAMGIVADGPKEFVILTDIAAFEDFYGNMDFKVAGTENGITAMQLDVKFGEKFHGLTLEMVEKTLVQAKDGRAFILKKMLALLPASRSTVSQYAPKVVTIQIPPEKIGEVIGPGGRNIKNIIATTSASVDIDDDGTVTVSSISEEAVQKAKDWIVGMTREVIVGEEFENCEVKRILNFGAFVEFLPGKEGLVHVSKMTAGFVSDPSQIVKVGDKVKVKVMEIDEMGRINLAMYWGPKEQQQPGMGNAFGSPVQGGQDFAPRPFRPTTRGGFGGSNRTGIGGSDRRGGRRDRY